MKKSDLIYSSILLVIIAIIGWLIYYFFSNLSMPTLTIISGAVGFIISKIYDSIRDNKQRMYEKKREVYFQLIKPYREVLKGVNNKKAVDPDETMISEAIDAGFDNILYASDEVVKAYGDFRNITADGNNPQPELVLKKLAILLKAMRKDLGNQFSTLDEVDILKIFINIGAQEENRYRELFKKPNFK